jgi:hypothetical protein
MNPVEFRFLFVLFLLGKAWHTLIDNFKTLRFTIMKWSVKERIEHLWI